MSVLQLSSLQSAANLLSCANPGSFVSLNAMNSTWVVPAQQSGIAWLESQNAISSSPNQQPDIFRRQKLLLLA